MEAIMKRISILLLILFTCFVSTSLRLAAQQPRYTVVDLGTLGGTFSEAGRVSDTGWMEGSYATLSGDMAGHAFLWRNGVMTDLGTFGGPNSESTYPQPNKYGHAVGGAETTIPDPLGENVCGAADTCLPFLWKNGVMTALPLLGGNNGIALGVNDWDQVVGIAENATVDSSCPPFLQGRPAIWKNGRVQELPLLYGEPDGFAMEINDRGQAVGGSEDCSNTLHSYLWQNGKAIDLGGFGGTRRNHAYAINNRGQIVGFASLPGNSIVHPYLWQNGVMTDLGVFPGDYESIAVGINNSAQIVGISFDAFGDERVILWQNGAMTDVNTLVPPDSSMYLLEAYSINDRGQISGTGYDYNTGELHAFLATPGGTEVPAGATRAITQHLKVTLPENVRNLLQGRGRFGGLKGELVAPQ
jgi:probable HAF family extracellular repeat protein